MAERLTPEEEQRILTEVKRDLGPDATPQEVMAEYTKRMNQKALGKT